MGSYFSRRVVNEVKNSLPVTQSKTNVNILINQAHCNQCNTTVRNNGKCKCGNLEVYGGTQELGRNVKNKSTVSDCNLIEYKPM